MEIQVTCAQLSDSLSACVFASGSRWTRGQECYNAELTVLCSPESIPTVKQSMPPIAASGAKRRSTRVAEAVPLVITWRGSQSQLLSEKTATLSINCHGCRYFSRFQLRKNTKIDVRIGATQNLNGVSQHFAARVAWVRKSRRLGGMYQVGIEFDTPRNVWHIGEEPADWSSFSSTASTEVSVSLLTEAEKLLQFAHAGNYYALLQVDAATAPAEVKRQFYHLASRFHPDHHMEHPEWTPRLLILMASLTTAYRTLSNRDTKKQYDSRLNRKLHQESSDLQHSARTCLEKSRECLAVKNYIGSILWLRRAIEDQPKSSRYRAMLAHSLAAVPEYRHEAAEQFEKAIELDPLHIANHLQYAKMLEQKRLPWRARPHYAGVLELDVNHTEARQRLNHIDSGAPRAASRSSLIGRLTGRR